MNECDWPILAGNDERINSHCLNWTLFDMLQLADHYCIVVLFTDTHNKQRYLKKGVTYFPIMMTQVHKTLLICHEELKRLLSLKMK